MYIDIYIYIYIIYIYAQQKVVKSYRGKMGIRHMSGAAAGFQKS